LVRTTRMFRIAAETPRWNPVTGCTHLCVYCWAKKLCEDRLRKMIPHYAEHGFNPALNESAFRRRFKPDTLVFVGSMGDMYCPEVPAEWIVRVIEYTRLFPRTLFLYCTKNPARYRDFVDLYPPNTILGTTIETNRDELAAPLTKAPPPSERYEAWASLEWGRLFLSVEPVLDFDLDEFFYGWIFPVGGRLFACEVGYDNYEHRLPEPPLAKVRKLVELKRRHGIDAREKTLREAWWGGVGAEAD